VIPIEFAHRCFAATDNDAIVLEAGIELGQDDDARLRSLLITSRDTADLQLSVCLDVARNAASPPAEAEAAVVAMLAPVVLGAVEA
jgi:hypothetical protein